MEPLFAPAAVGPSDGFHPVFGSDGLAKMAHDAVMSCDDSIRGDLLSNVLLSGGLSECPGIAERLQKELAALFPSDQPPATVKAPPERRLLPWVGGSMLASLPQFNGMCRTADATAPRTGDGPSELTPPPAATDGRSALLAAIQGGAKLIDRSP